MILSIFKKYNKISQKKKLIKSIINNLEIKESQKSLYIDSIDYLDEDWLEKLYSNLEKFIKNIEEKKFESIKAWNFWKISGLRKKEAREKQKELNSFWFLISNL